MNKRAQDKVWSEVMNMLSKRNPDLTERILDNKTPSPEKIGLKVDTVIKKLKKAFPKISGKEITNFISMKLGKKKDSKVGRDLSPEQEVMVNDLQKAFPKAKRKDLVDLVIKRSAFRIGLILEWMEH